MEAAVKMKIQVRCNISSLLKEMNKTQSWLAREISDGLDSPVSAQMISDWCNNRYVPHVGYILRMIRVTGWKIEDMFEEE